MTHSTQQGIEATHDNDYDYEEWPDPEHELREGLEVLSE